MSEILQSVEYVWIDGCGDLRSKTKIISRPPNWEENQDNHLTPKFYPDWNYDGSSTKQADGNNSEVIIKPQAVFHDCFRRNSKYSKIVLCDTYIQNDEGDIIPHSSNTRVQANAIFEKYYNEKSMFGIEQEFFITKNNYPIGFPEDRKIMPREQGDYYCGLGGSNIYGREFMENAMDNCLYSGINITGMNSEVAPSQWEFQVCNIGISAADELYMLRYILKRTSENFGWSIDFHPKPIVGDWNGSGCHVNFSTIKMRNEGGYDLILKAIDNLSKNHDEHMKQYGCDNELRMTGEHETANYNVFSYGVANRGASIRIPRQTQKNKYGYFEDRRPASNMDPYIVTSMILNTSMGEEISSVTTKINETQIQTETQEEIQQEFSQNKDNMVKDKTNNSINSSLLSAVWG